MEKNTRLVRTTRGIGMRVPHLVSPFFGETGWDFMSTFMSND